MTVEWRSILGGFYAVSADGRVVRQDAGSLLGQGRLMRQSLVQVGKSARLWRVRVRLLLPGSGTQQHYVHRLVAGAFLPSPDAPEKDEVDHIDGNPLNNAVENLEWVTHAENARRASRLGLLEHGSRRYNARFTEDDVVRIRQRYLQGESVTTLAATHKAGVHTIHALLRGETWAHVPGAIDPAILKDRRNGRKLTEALVRTIRDEHAQGATQASLCRKYSMHPASMSDLIRGRIWKHVD